MARSSLRSNSAWLALVANVAAYPDDDAPRLVAADWLDDYGRPERAEFIRVQCELARLDRYNPRRLGLKRRATALHTSNAKRWVANDGLAGIRYPEFGRGFVEKAVFDSCAEFLEQGPHWFERTPLRAAYVRDQAPAPPAAFIDSPLLERLQTLEISRCISVEWATERVVRAGPRGEGSFYDIAVDFLRRIEASGQRQPIPVRDPLADLVLSSRLAQLRELDLNGSWFETGFLAVFESAPNLARLETLDLTDTSFPVSDFRSLTTSPHLANLRRLRAKPCDSVPEIGVEGLAMLAASPYLTCLEELDLCSQPLGAAGWQLLAGWPGLARLQRLCLDGTALSADGTSMWANDDPEPGFVEAIQALVHSPHWGKLRELDLGDALQRPWEVEALLSSPWLGSLRVLRIKFHGDYCDAHAADAICALLAGCPYLDGLVELAIGIDKASRKAKQLLRERFGERLSGWEWEPRRPARTRTKPRRGE